jgi:tRNA G10  N-methylase Trm11
MGENEDWTFAGVDTQYMTHGLHMYPARMIPQIARKLIDKFTFSNEDVVLDPFCGSGGVLVEAMLKGNTSIGVDINPLAILIAKVKTTPLEPEKLTSYADSLLSKIHDDIKRGTEYEVPDIKNIEFWFKPKVIKDLSIVRKHIENLKDEDENVYDFFRVCFSYTVRKTSNVRGREFKLYRIPAEELESYNPDVVRTFENIVRANISRMKEFYQAVGNSKVKAYPLKGDARKLLEIEPTILHEESVNLVVTSPPYGDSHTTVAYGQFSRYPALWLGFDEKEVMEIDDAGLGGKVINVDLDKLESPLLAETYVAVAEKDERRARELLSYFWDIDVCLEQLSKVLKKGKSYCCFVLGNRTVRRVKVPTDRILVELSRKYGFEHVDTKYRRIPMKRIPWVNAPENIPGKTVETINKESIIIWRV